MSGSNFTEGGWKTPPTPRAVKGEKSPVLLGLTFQLKWDYFVFIFIFIAQLNREGCHTLTLFEMGFLPPPNCMEISYPSYVTETLQTAISYN